MRLFIAFDLPKNVIEKLTGFQKQIGDENARVKWVEPHNVHLTLKFLGEVEESKVEKIIEKVKVVKFKSFLTSIAELGVFPSEKFIRVIWIGLKPFEPIEELHEKIDSMLTNLGFEKDRKFQAHVTLGRVKFVTDKPKFLSKLKMLKFSEFTEPFVIDNFKLKKSTLTGKGPIYSDLYIFKGQK